MINYYFNKNGIYTHNLPANPNTLPPDNALRIAPEFQEGFYPIINSTKDAWLQIEDHRQHKNEQDQIIEGSGTPYWLPEDNYQSESRYIAELGKLPENVLFERPVKTLEEAKAEKLEEIIQYTAQEEAAGYVNSSLGFKANATRKSKEDVGGILQSMENSKASIIMFRDYDNLFHALTLEQVKILQVEIINNGLQIYQHKWDLQALVENGKTIAEIEGVLW